MRSEPTWRIPVGILGMLLGLAIYAALIAHYLSPLIGGWPVLAQMLAYVALGLLWLTPMKPFLKWMETGRWR